MRGCVCVLIAETEKTDKKPVTVITRALLSFSLTHTQLLANSNTARFQRLQLHYCLVSTHLCGCLDSSTRKHAHHSASSLESYEETDLSTQCK